MELVATSKLRRAREKAENSRPYHEMLRIMIGDISGSSEAAASVWRTPNPDGKMLYIVVAGDRGLAGGYNANIFRLTMSMAKDKDSLFLPVGKKAVEYFRHRGLALFSDLYSTVSDVGVGEAFRMASAVCEAYREGLISGVTLVYTKFVSMLSQLATCEKLLPLSEERAKTCADPRFECDAEEMLDKMIPEYLGGMVFSAVCEALASESGARRSAMNAANKNAEEMIGTLMLQFNRARQAVITQEITEIVSGAQK
jgi:F-type H+-transporting ATPase subunit gamma